MWSIARCKEVTCDNCFEVQPLCNMSNGQKCCEPCSKDIEELTSRIHHHNERD